jgi:hypothetical protein
VQRKTFRLLYGKVSQWGRVGREVESDCFKKGGFEKNNITGSITKYKIIVDFNIL